MIAPARTLVQSLRFLDRPDQGQPGELERRLALREHGVCLGIETVRMAPEDFRRRGRHGAVDIDLGLGNGAGGRQEFDIVKQFLGALHGEGGNDEISPAGRGGFDRLGQLLATTPGVFVEPIAVGGLDEQVVGLVHRGRVADDRRPALAEIARENQLGPARAFSDPDLDDSRAQDMPGVEESDAQAGEDLEFLGIFDRFEEGQGLLRVLHGIEGLFQGAPGPFGLAVAPFHLHHLDMSRIRQHHRAKIGRGLGGDDPAAEALSRQAGQEAAVVDMSVGEEHRIEAVGLEEEGVPVARPNFPFALEHSAVDQQAPAGRLQQVAGTGYRPCRAAKSDLQSHPSWCEGYSPRRGDGSFLRAETAATAASNRRPVWTACPRP